MSVVLNFPKLKLVGFKNRKHYSHKMEDINRILQSRGWKPNQLVHLHEQSLSARLHGCARPPDAPATSIKTGGWSARLTQTWTWTGRFLNGSVL